MTLRAADIDSIRFATVDRGYSEAEVDEFVANVGISLSAAEAAPRLICTPTASRTR